MRYPAYEEYKDSGVDWFSSVPTHWTASSLKRSGQVTLGKMFQPERKTPHEASQPYLRAAHVQPYGLDSASEKEMWFSPDEQVRLDLREQDVVVVEGGAGFGRSAYLPRTLAGWGFQNSINRIRVSSADEGRFIDFTLRSALASGHLEVVCNKATIPHLTADKLREIQIPRPPLAEQKQIADFLDRETEQIDNLIAEQEGLVENLTERRKAVISHAVTKGLNPEAELRDSGLEWSRQIPAGWVVDRISHLFRLISSGTTPDNDDLVGGDGDVCWVTTGELRENYISGTRQAVSFEIVQRTPTLKVYPPGTLLIAMYGATIGRLGILNVPACTNQACCAMSGPLGVETRFIYFAFQGALEHIMLLASGGGQPNINQDKVRSFRIPVPPLPEQREIVAYLENQTALIAELIEEAKALIDLLKERRSALISAAVTGKIDVRSEVLSRG